MLLIITKWSGATAKQYNDLTKHLNLTNSLPKGNLSHTAGIDDDGLCIADIWESEQDFDTFLKKSLMPAIQQLHIPGKPEVTKYNVHRTQSKGAGVR